MSDNNWSGTKEHKLREWQQKCKIHSYAHALSNEYYNSLSYWLNGPSIVLGVVSILLQGAALVWSDQNTPLTAVSLVTTSIVTGISAWLQIANPSDSAASHAQISMGYQRIALEIDSELTNDVNERSNGSEFIRRIAKEMNKLATGAITVPIRIWRNVKQSIIKGEMDFDKIKHSPEPSLTEAHHVLTHISTKPKPNGEGNITETLNNIMNVSLDLSGNEIVETDADTDSDETIITMGDNTFPSTDYRAQTEAEAVIMQKLLDFQQSRFG